MSRPMSVHIVDDDEAIRVSVSRLLITEGFAVETHASAMDFIRTFPEASCGCLVTDVRMPEMSGMDLLDYVRDHGLDVNVILLTGHADVPLAVQATKRGAVDVLEKPFRADVLIATVRNAMSQCCKRAPEQDPVLRQGSRNADARFASLSARERDVLDQLVLGRQNKIVAYELGISHRTVEIHRAKILKKTGTSSLPELIRLYLSKE